MQQPPAMKAHSYRRRPTNNKPNRSSHNGGERRTYPRSRSEGSGSDADVYNVSMGSKAYQRALQMREKYLELAKDAQIGGDRVLAENYFQHADHFGRVINAANEAAREVKQPSGDERNQRRHEQNNGGETSNQSEDLLSPASESPLDGIDDEVQPISEA